MPSRRNFALGLLLLASCGDSDPASDAGTTDATDRPDSGPGDAASPDLSTGDDGGVPLVCDETRSSVDIDATASQACAIRGGELWCWGNISRSRPSGTERPVRHELVADPRKVSVGDSFTCVIDCRSSLGCDGPQNTSIVCAGEDSEGRLGRPAGGISSLFEGIDGDNRHWVDLDSWNRSHAINADGTIWRWGDRILAPEQVGTSTAWVQASSGGGYACALSSTTTDQRTLHCAGTNTLGQLGTGEGPGILHSTFVRAGTASDWLTVSAGPGHACGLRAPGSLWCWGDNENGKAGLGTVASANVPTRVGADDDWSAVSAGAFSSCAIKRDGSLWCFGSTEAGQLGIGPVTQARIDQPTRVGTDTWDEVAVAGGFACARNTSGRVFCWGSGHFGQLGRRDVATSDVPVPVCFPVP